MKLSTHQIQSILKDFGGGLTDRDILFLLHDELDFDILLPLIHRLEFGKREDGGGLKEGLCSGIGVKMLRDIFETFPRLLVWLFINKEEKLQEYLKLFSSFSDVSQLLSLNYSGSPKVNDHIRSTMAILFEGQTEISKTDGIIYRRGVMSQSQEGFLSRVVGNIIPTMFAGGADSGIVDGDHSFTAEPETILSEIEKLLHTPLILASEPRAQVFGDYTYQDEQKAPRAVRIGKVTVNCTVENLMGRNPSLPTKYLKRLYSAHTCVEVWLDVTAKEYLVVVGTKTSISTQAYTKRAVVQQVQKQVPNSIKMYLEEVFMGNLRKDSCGISTAQFSVKDNRGYSMEQNGLVQYEVLHFPVNIIESIR